MHRPALAELYVTDDETHLVACSPEWERARGTRLPAPRDRLSAFADSFRAALAKRPTAIDQADLDALAEIAGLGEAVAQLAAWTEPDQHLVLEAVQKMGAGNR